jgi:hypothetical protein
MIYYVQIVQVSDYLIVIVTLYLKCNLQSLSLKNIP